MKKMKFTTEQRAALFESSKVDGKPTATMESINQLCDYAEASMNSTLSGMAKSFMTECNKKAKRKYSSLARESFRKAKKRMYERVDMYLDSVVSEWHKKNKLSVGMTIENTSNKAIVDGLIGLLESSYVKVPHARKDVIESLSKHAASIENIALENKRKAKAAAARIVKLERKIIAERVSSGLPTSKREKFLKLASEMQASSRKGYAKKLINLRKNMTESSSPSRGRTKIHLRNVSEKRNATDLASAAAQIL